MCLIMYGFTKDILLKKEWLENAFVTNPDGIGVTNGTTTFYPKSVTQLEAILGTFDGQALIHFRYATKGRATIHNTHPFVLEDGTLLVHNGTMTFEDMEGIMRAFNLDEDKYHDLWFGSQNKYSDTKILAMILDEIPAMYYTWVLECLTDSKFGLWRPGQEVELIGEFKAKSGILLSNLYSIESWDGYGSDSISGGFECPDCISDMGHDWNFCAYCGLDIVKFLEEEYGPTEQKSLHEGGTING